MSKPQPKTELVATADPHMARRIFLHFASDDARSWIQTNAGQFGQLFDEEHQFTLYVSPVYDFDQVLTYLQSGYNDES